MNRFWAAVRFLTVFPVPFGWGEAPEDLVRSKPFFPVVGMLIGAVTAGIAWAFGRVFPDLPASVLTAMCLVLASGGLHMDGLSDTADGLFSARCRERMLEIMRDSHIGAMGVMAVVAVFSLKAALLAALPQPVRWRGVFLMPVAGRCALVVSMAVLPYVRAGGGLGTVFYARGSRVAALWALAVFGLAGWAIAGWRGLAAAGASATVTLGMGLYIYRKIRGATGDTLGATCEAVETVPALILCAWPLAG